MKVFVVGEGSEPGGGRGLVMETRRKKRRQGERWQVEGRGEKEKGGEKERVDKKKGEERRGEERKKGNDMRQ